jgi:cytochrome c oxidase subunit II
MERWLGLPALASEHGHRLDYLTGLVHWMMLILFVVWGAFFLYLVIRFRRSRNPQASYEGTKSKVSTYGEVAVAIAEVVLLVGFSIPLYSARIDDTPDESEATVVRVKAQQFAWNVHYPGADGIFGMTKLELVDAATNPLGLDRSDPNAKDDFTTINQLHLPVHKKALIYLSSMDVIHSFFLPEMRVKQDAIPGLEFPVWFEPTVTTAEMRETKGNDAFNYEIACAQLCGNSHATMRGFLTIHPQEEYDAWVAEQEAALAEEEGGDDFWG